MEIVRFAGSTSGAWRVTGIEAIRGDSLPGVSHLQILEGDGVASAPHAWVLRGVRSHLHYTQKTEKEELMARQAALGRAEAVCAVLIPIQKSAAWWELAQDERRMIFEEQSQHIRTGARYLPAIARRLYHSRDLGEPFDFLTWFEFAPAHAPAFAELLGALRASREWAFVAREVEVRLTWTGEPSTLHTTRALSGTPPQDGKWIPDDRPVG